MSSPAPSSAAHRTTGWWILLSLLVLCAAASRLSHYFLPFEGDGAVFIYMGRVISEGGRFGPDIVDNKFPTVALMFSSCWRIFGAHWTPYVLLGAALSAGAVAALTRGARRSFGPHGGDATLLFAIVYLNFSLIIWILGGFQLETPLIFFTSLGAMAALEALRGGDARDAFALGLCAGTAALLKPTGLAVGAVFALAVLLGGSSWRSILRLGLAAFAGLLIPLGVAMAYLIGSDTLREMPAIYREISAYAANSSWDWGADFGKPIVILFLVGFPLLVRGWICRRQRSDEGTHSRAMLIFVLGWFLLETIGVVMQRRMYGYHFLVMAPPLALLFGYLPRRASVGQLAAALAPVTLLSIYGIWLMFHNGLKPRTLPASDYLLAHARHGDAVWSDNAFRLLLETGLRPGSRCPLTFLMGNYDEAPLHYSQMILTDFEARRPRFIVLAADMPQYVQFQADHILEFIRFPKRRENFFLAWQRIDRYVRTHYRPAVQIGKECVWERSEGSGVRGEGSASEEIQGMLLPKP